MMGCTGQEGIGEESEGDSGGGVPKDFRLGNISVNEE